MLIPKIIGKPPSYKKKLLFFLLLIGIFPVLSLGLAASHLFSQQMQQEVNRNHRLTLDMLHNRLDDKISAMTLSSISLASNVAIEKSVAAGPGHESLPLTQDMIRTIRRSLAYFPLKLNVSMLYLKHDYVYSDLQQPQKLEETIYPDILHHVKPPYNSSFFVSPNTIPNQPDLLLLCPVPLNSMYTEGVLVLHLGIAELNGFLNDLELDGRMKINMIDDKGRMFFSRNKEEIGTLLTSADELYDYWLEPAKFGGKVRLDDVRYTVSAQKSDFTGWTYVVMTPYKELAKTSIQMKGVTLTIAVVFMLLCVALARFGFRELFRPFRSLLAKMQTTGDAQLPYDNEIEALDAVLQRLIRANKHLHDEIRELMPLAKERIYHFLINGELEESEMRRLSDRFGLPLHSPWIYVGVAQVDDDIRFNRTYRGRERSMIHWAMRKAMEALGEHTVPCITFVPEPGQIVVLFAAEKADDRTFGQICHIMKQFRAHAADVFRFTVSAAISDARREDACISAGYREALHMLSYRLLYGHNVTITSRDIRQRALLQSEEFMLRYHKSIVMHLLHGNAEGAVIELEQWLEDVGHYSPSSEHAIGLLSYLLGELEYKLHEIGCRIHEIVSYDLLGRLRQMTALTEIRAWLADELFPAIVCHLERVQDPKYKRVVRQVEAYLLERYEEDITLQLTADRFGISPSFLSRIFKEATGRSFSDYLLEVRMNKAMEWLAHTDWPLQHISDRLTYSTVQNFSRIFKKMTGAPPGEYRRQRREDSRTS
ncbi:MAG: AraC family transcriptional regulator [Paenibacillus sp.]|nr:AraC family transcriptional regulator [Paenibacillus sp.]